MYGTNKQKGDVMNLSTLVKRGFEGVDVDLRTSLAEYGIAWKEFKINLPKRSIRKGEFLFYYGVKMEDDEYGSAIYTKFDCGYLHPDSFESDFNWAELDQVADCYGLDLEDWMDLPFGSRINDLVSYYGIQNVFGSSYCEPIPIGGVK